MATPMSAFLREGASFTPSPVIATICLLAWIAFTRRSLCSGLARANTSTPCALLLQRGTLHLLDLGTGNHCLAVADTQHLGDGRGGDSVVASNHRYSDTAGMAFLDGIDRFLARRIEQADQP